ncbi:MAG: PIN domain-containing protein [Prevotellaceae bacterium]|jgi:PIN domain nuclease of toxin-antitoxin system|nr:PIN domain-containing protein [Prevotellaceae bacterium]
MQYYLDTNILVFLLQNRDEIGSDVEPLLFDYGNLLYTSSVAIAELLLLFRIGKLEKKQFKTEQDLLDGLGQLGIEIVYFNEKHLVAYTNLKIKESHKDMNDHAIIAQAIADKRAVIFSDRAFKHYVAQGLDFVFNKR